MAATSHNVLGVSSRRSACDRCRSSKARCMRKHRTQACCDRCQRSDTDCVTSPIFKLRSWQPRIQSGGSIDFFQCDDIEDNDQLVDDIRERNASEEAMSDFVMTSSNTNLRTNFVANPSGHEVADYGSMSSILDSLDGHFLATSLNDQLGCATSLPQDSPDSFATASTPSMQIEFPTTAPYILPPPVGATGSLSSQVDAHATLGTSACSTLDSEHMNLERSGQSLSQGLLTLDQNLLDVITRLTRQSARLILIKDGAGSGMSPYSVRTVLSMTTQFIDTVKAICNTYLVPTEPYASHGHDELRQTAPVSSDHQRARSFAYDSVTSVPLLVTGQKSYESDDLDVTISVQILYVYMHLLKIYRIVLQHLVTDLEKVAESEDPQLPEDLGLDEGLLSKSGNLQIHVFLQTVINSFERMESMLGLPEEFNMTKRRPLQRGLFRMNGFAEPATAILSLDVVKSSSLRLRPIDVIKSAAERIRHLLAEQIIP